MAFQALKLWGVAMVATFGIGLAGCTTDQINMATQAIGMVTAPNNGAVGLNTIPTATAQITTALSYAKPIRSPVRQLVKQMAHVAKRLPMSNPVYKPMGRCVT
jgi:hypothetical protein